MRRTIPALVIAVAIQATTASAQPRPPVWDSRGWVELGEREVTGNYDHDRIEVGKVEGKFTKVTLVVENSDLEMIDFKIVFGDKTEYHPKVSHFFREGQRTQVLDLPPSENVIRFIDFKYKNLPGGGSAKVQCWALRSGDAAQPPRRHSWDTNGWTMLGERQVNGNVDHDRIDVGKADGKFTKLTMAVEDSDLELLDLKIQFSDRTEYHPKLQFFFKEGQRTRVIDLPPGERSIQYVDLRYRNVRGGGNAAVELWGFRVGGGGGPVWDSKGWTPLGERTVDGRYDHDRIDVGPYEGRFSKLTIAVESSDLEMIDFTITFGNGQVWRPNLSHYFKEGQRTRAIDFPGDERMIKAIDFKYRNLPGGGRAKVAVFGLKEQGGGNVWDNRGWQMLGEQRVDSNREDTDKIGVGKYQGRFAKLTLVVLDSDLEMIDFAIKFDRGAPYHPEVKAFFKENSRTKVIDLPGDERVIKWIEFKYRNLNPGQRARVQVWGK